MGLDWSGERFAAKRLGNGPAGITLRASLAAGAVCHEPFSATRRQVTGKITGISFKSQPS